MKQKRFTYWVQALSFVVVIYATLPLVRPICTFLQKNTPFALVTNLSLGAFLLFLVFHFLKNNIRVLNPFLYFLLGLSIIMFWAIFRFVPIPEEKIHFPEYGFLAYLLYRALKIDVSNKTAYLVSFLLCAGFGWLDEGIQFLLPNRYYETKDVILNILGGGLGLYLTFIVEKAKSLALREKNR